MDKALSPAISVVMTSYNHREYLSQSLNAIVDQTFHDYEFIIWDDNSTDGSKELLAEFQKNNLFATVILRDNNSGRYTISTNSGASIAKGNFIIFEQCDDYADSNQLDLLYKAAVEHPSAGIIFSASRMVDEKGKYLKSDYDVRSRSFQKYCHKDCLIPKDKLEDFLLDACVLPNLSAVLIRREIFEQLKGLDEDYLVVADWDFYLRACSLCDAYYIRTELNNFRQHGTTIRNSVRMEKQIEELLKMFDAHFKTNNTQRNKRMRAYATVTNVWVSFLKKNPKIWLSSFNKILRLSKKYGKYKPTVLIWNLLIHPFKSLNYKLTHIR